MNLVHEGVLPPNEPDDRDERREEWEMAQKLETVADIVAELRNKTGNMYDCSITTDEEEFHSYADRIEEAWTREREELDKRISDLEAYAKLWTGRADELRLKCDEFYAKAKHVGNSAAMREALVALRDAARNFYHQILNSKYNDIMDEYKCRERGLPALLDLRYAIPKANFALTEPPRNCDRFADGLDAQLAFLNEVWLISIDRETMTEQDTYEKWTDEMRTRYGRWLLAPAAERKGE